MATHLLPVLPAEASPEPLTELRAIAASLRSHLGWLREGGVAGLPRPLQLPGRPRALPPSAGAPLPTSGLRPPESPMPPARSGRPPLPEPPGYPYEAQGSATDAAAAARAALQTSARSAATSYRPPVERDSAYALAPPTALKGPPAQVHYPELDESVLGQLPGAGALAQIRQLIGDCRRCKLCHGRNNIVFGQGNPEPWLVFVGEGPGADEDRTGEPFVGAAGELLDRMINAMAEEAGKRGHAELRPYLSRPQVYIANVVKCRPPGNRTPEADEIATCSPFLDAQLRSLRPRVIVTLGRTPTHYLLKTSAPISRIRGQFAEWNGIPVMPTYHPAYLLRTPSAKQQVWEDLKQVIERLSLPPVIPIRE